MPRVQLPDGRVVEVPDDATPEQLSAFRERIAADFPGVGSFTRRETSVSPAPRRTLRSTALNAAGSSLFGVGDIFRAYRMREDAKQSGTPLSFPEALSLVSGQNEADEQSNAPGARLAAEIGRKGGEVAAAAPFAALSAVSGPVPALGARALPLAAEAALGGAAGASEAFVRSAGDPDAALRGGAVGALTGAAAPALTRALSPSRAAVREAANISRRVEVTPRRDGTFRRRRETQRAAGERLQRESDEFRKTFPGSDPALVEIVDPLQARDAASIIRRSETSKFVVDKARRDAARRAPAETAEAVRAGRQIVNADDVTRELDAAADTARAKFQNKRIDLKSGEKDFLERALVFTRSRAPGDLTADLATIPSEIADAVTNNSLTLGQLEDLRGIANKFAGAQNPVEQHAFSRVRDGIAKIGASKAPEYRKFLADFAVSSKRAEGIDSARKAATARDPSKGVSAARSERAKIASAQGIAAPADRLAAYDAGRVEGTVGALRDDALTNPALLARDVQNPAVQEALSASIPADEVARLARIGELRERAGRSFDELAVATPTRAQAEAEAARGVADVAFAAASPNPLRNPFAVTNFLRRLTLPPGAAERMSVALTTPAGRDRVIAYLRSRGASESDIKAVLAASAGAAASAVQDEAQQ